MYIGKYRLPIMSSLLIWAVRLGNRRATRAQASSFRRCRGSSPASSRSCPPRPSVTRCGSPARPSSSAISSPSASACRWACSWAARSLPTASSCPGSTCSCRRRSSALVPVIMVVFGVGADHHRAHRGALRHLDHRARRPGRGAEHHALARRNGAQLRGQPLARPSARSSSGRRCRKSSPASASGSSAP